MAPGQMKKLESDPSVKYIDEDQVITLVQPDIKIKAKPAPTPSAEVTPWGIARVKGGVTYTGSNKIWIIDTGIDLDHPDLNVDLVNGWNFVDVITSYSIHYTKLYDLICSLILSTTALFAQDEFTLVKQGEKAPDFSFETAPGKTVKLSELKGKRNNFV